MTPPFPIGDAFRSAAWPAEQGGRKHGPAGIAAISANAAKGWRSAGTGGSLPPMSVSALAFASSVNAERVVPNTTRSGHLRSVWIRMLIV